MVARKWCFVPGCMNTTIRTPTKIFVSVPKQKKKKWFAAVKRDFEKVSSTSTLYCCEDHFNLEEDMDNYLQYKLSKVKARIKDGVVPHIFSCQSDKTVYERKARKRKISELSCKSTEPGEPVSQPSTSRSAEIGFQSCRSMAELKAKRDVGTQTRILTHFRSKGIQVSFSTSRKNVYA